MEFAGGSCPAAAPFTSTARLAISVREEETPVRPEIQRSVEDIQQAIALLRRHL
jgi:hypothetical protein